MCSSKYQSNVYHIPSLGNKQTNTEVEYKRFSSDGALTNYNILQNSHDPLMSALVQSALVNRLSLPVEGSEASVQPQQLHMSPSTAPYKMLSCEEYGSL